MKGSAFMLILTINTFCQELSPVLKMIGDFLNIFKICLPLVLIALCIFDIGKAIISSKSEDVKKYMKNGLKKLAVCVIVFFVPVICMMTFGFVGGFKDITENSGIDYRICYDCMFNPSSDDCQNAIEIAELNS